MAKTITQLDSVTSGVVGGSDELIVQQSGVTKKATKTQVLNGIVNANIANNAAILGTKIAPNFGDQNVTTTGNVTADRIVADEGTTSLPGVVFTGDGDTGMWHPDPNVLAFSVDGTEKLRINSGGIVAAQLTGNAATATTLATARTVDISGDVTGTAQSFNGSANITIPAAITADVIVNADVNTNANIAGTKINPNFGALAVVTTGNVTANRLVAGTGSAAEASVTFTSDGDTGMFRPEANTLAFCEGGTEAMRINSSGLVGVATTDPQYRLDVNGVVNSASHYRVDGSQVVGARATGWAAPTGTATRTTFATASVTLPDLAERVHALIDDLIAHGLIGPTVS